MNRTSHADLIDHEIGIVSRSVFDSPAIYETEQRKIFARSWLFVAHESQIRDPGDFVVSRMAEDSVIVSRQADGDIAVVLNVCRHRGMRVCRVDEGNAPRFTCSYHGWSYDGTGTLTDVPHEADAYRNRLDKARWSLVRVPHVESFLGLIFACWDTDAMPLSEWLGSYADVLRGAFDRSPAGTEVLGGILKWRLGGNWKLAAEQFTGDNYHPETSHVSATTAQMESMVFSPDIEQKIRESASSSEFVNVGFPQGHGSSFIAGDEEDLRSFMTMTLPPALAATWHTEHTRQRLGALAYGPGTMINMMFPNFAWLGSIRTLRVFHPQGVQGMEIWSWTFVDADWPTELKQAYRSYGTRSFSTTGIFEIDDSENWAQIAAISGGAMTRRVPMNYQLGLGADTDASRIGMTGRLNSAMSETNALNFHRAWAEMMDGPEPSLPDLSPAPLLPAEPETRDDG